jgi:hypothetical protein
VPARSGYAGLTSSAGPEPPQRRRRASMASTPNPANSMP